MICSRKQKLEPTARLSFILGQRAVDVIVKDVGIADVSSIDEQRLEMGAIEVFMRRTLCPHKKRRRTL